MATLVTGAAQGIGCGICLELAEAGYDVLCCDLERQRSLCMSNTVEKILDFGGQASFFACDVLDREQLQAAVAKAVALSGHLAVSVCTVGGPISLRSSILTMPPDDYLATVAMTQHATFFQLQLSAQQMERQIPQGGSIIIIGSIMADFSSPTAAAYSSAKCAVRQLGKTAAVELAPHRIRVNVVQPGYVDTPGERVVASEEEIANSATCIPLQRMGLPSDIGHMVAFLASEKATYITGGIFDVDGGYKSALALPGHTQRAGTATRARSPS